ncbi:hypothetical protein M378DRAFT_173139, partial [Amanita muscaria Koide BX008]
MKPLYPYIVCLRVSPSSKRADSHSFPPTSLNGPLNHICHTTDDGISSDGEDTSSAIS